MKFWKMLSLVTLLLLAASIVRADDTRVVSEGGGGHSPDCGSALFEVNGAGILSADCHVSIAPVTTYTFEVADSSTTGGGLTCQSHLVTIDGWTLTPGKTGGIDTCTFTAPTTVSWETKLKLWLMGDPYTGKNDGDCDLDDFVLGIPVGCDITFNNPSTAKNPNLFVPDSEAGVASNGNSLPPLPEPGTLSLLLIGLASLPFVRRKLAR